MAKAPGRMDFDELDEEYRKHFKSRHVTPPLGEEAYDFNIKIRKVNVPKIARNMYSEQEIDDHVRLAMESALNTFAEWVRDEFDWWKGWAQEGRSGGWLVVYADVPAFILSFEEGARPSYVRQRIRDLRKIEERLKAEKKELIEHLEDLEFWDISPRDWSPRWKK